MIARTWKLTLPEECLINMVVDVVKMRYLQQIDSRPYQLLSDAGV